VTGVDALEAVVVAGAVTLRASQQVKLAPVTAMATATVASHPPVAKAPALRKKVAVKALAKVNRAHPHRPTTQSHAKAPLVPHKVNLTRCAPAWT
jgi:hypothetical protein